MQIFTPEQIREWDEFTIEHEPISSLNLMERASAACVHWLEANQLLKQPFSIFCGKGNNGGDGLAISRMLSTKSVKVSCYILESGHKGTADFQANLARLHETKTEILYLQSDESLPAIGKDDVVIDAIFGSGLNRPPEQLVAKLIAHINRLSKQVIAIDIPSGMYAGKSSKGNEVIKANYTLSFQGYKLAFLLPENENNTGKLSILDIGLHGGYLEKVNSLYEILKADFIKAIYQPRKLFAHKGTFGHALLVGGSYGKIGAMVLCSRACLRTGVGLLSSFTPRCGYDVMQTAVPEAMVITAASEEIIDEQPPAMDKYNAIGIGPGLGTAPETVRILEEILRVVTKPLVIDADALNILSTKPALIRNLPPFSILTPHPKEFERLFGTANNDFERLNLARDKAREFQVIIILKGHHSFIAMPGGKGFFNSTGNPGMATGGSGDVLTGILTSLLAQGYSPAEASLLGVYLHGLAGDYAAASQSEEAMIASDIVESLAEAFRFIQS